MSNTTQIEPRRFGCRVPVHVMEARGAIEDMRLHLASPQLMIGAEVPPPDRLAIAAAVREECRSLAATIPDAFGVVDLTTALTETKRVYRRGLALVTEATLRHRALLPTGLAH